MVNKVNKLPAFSQKAGQVSRLPSRRETERE
jgi:hypothetical protein